MMDLLRLKIVSSFCDDLSFDGNDAFHKSLKAVLGKAASKVGPQCDPVRHLQPRHLLAREMIENERSTRSIGEQLRKSSL